MLTPSNLFLVQLSNYPIFQQLQLEEALLRADQRNWCLINDGTQPAIVMGISGKTELLINRTRLLQNPCPVIRRFSGGGTVFVDESTCFVTFICNAEHVNVPPCPEKVLHWTADLYQQAFPHLDFKLMENDYAIGNRKFGGNAQYLCKGRWLHHSSLLWDFHLERMDYLLMPPKTPKYRQQRAHGDFLMRLRDVYHCRESFKQEIRKTLASRFVITEMTLEQVHEVLERPHRQATKSEKF